MRFWDNLRTAIDLANRIANVEQRIKGLEWEWGEVSEKLLTREERLRKRLTRELKATLDEGANGPSPSTSDAPIGAPEGSQAAKKAIITRFRILDKRRGEG